ncbi:TonB-dependent receptor [Hymenobacter sp. BT507]|uniref:TonB-dependent receptor n=1 Tax=Hymenobacter citatus TaxID=2763506 RepID=A0ABR7MJW3_9BACT|nr:TonB-dependent receptor [Hymenobacter citatus]MBC6611223.1 TonB-dependent receptor [Hymenobacter citatus]
MKKNVRYLHQIALPSLLCCLPMTLAAAAPPAPRIPLRHVMVADITISGRVVDETGTGLPGVNVVVKGTSNGAQTDTDGRYTLTVPDNATVVFSFVGYTSQEVAVSGRTSIDVSLKPDAQTLNDVVVVGYLTQKREDVTGSVATTTGTEVRRAPVATVTEAIQGRLPGVQVTNSGVPGQSPTVNIRGIGSINNGSSPLYVVDGLWTFDIRDFNPQDVETVQVLKDAASLAAYGASGANGVIIITTRRGRSGETKVNLSASGGPQVIGRTYDLVGADRWREINNQSYDNAGLARQPFAATDNGVNTDWQKELLQHGSVQNYDLGFSGGGPNSNFLISAGYFNQKGIIEGPKFERYSLRVNSGFTKGKLKVGESLLLTRANQTRLNGVPFNDVLRMLPVIPVYNEDNPGGYGFGNTNASTFGTNPIALQNLLNDTNTQNHLQGSVFGEFSFTNFLRYRLNLATDYYAFHDQAKRQYGQWRQNDPLNPSSFAENQGSRFFGLAENTLTFDKSFGLHNVTAVAGYSEQRTDYSLTRGINYGYGTGPTYYWALEAGTQNPAVEGNQYTFTKRSYFGQVTYDYDQRYLLTGAYRRDGSSRFDPANRYGNFYAASAGWRISKEHFFENIGSSISNLKLRASYGSLGNDQLNGPYGASYLTTAAINTNVNYPFGPTQTIVNGKIQTQLPSLRIGWEERRTTNVGLDMGLLEDRLTLSADYYVAQTRQALVNPVPPIFLGNAGTDPYQRIGRLENSGFELNVGYSDTRSAFTYGASANLTTIRNRVEQLGGNGQIYQAGPNGAARTEVGYEIGSFYLYQYDGVFQTADEVAASAQPEASPGDARYRDINNDGIINDLDRVHVGRVFPKIQYGVNLTAGYANFDIAALFQGVQGNDVLNVGKWWVDRGDDNSNYRTDYNPWTPENPTNTPRAVKSGGGGAGAYSAANNSRINSTRWLENGSYLRLKNLQIGYNVPQTALNKVKGIGSVRVYLTGQNVFTITKYSGYDPETPGGGSLARGIDDGTYPVVRSYTAGIQLGF